MKRLVVCCDGTWNRRDAGKRATNVVKVAETVRPVADGVRQVVFYDAGVGTGGWLDRVVGGATGKGLAKNVLDGYRFLARSYRPGDDIYLFGFSRGAYTARSIAGMVRKCGVLRKPLEERVQEAYRLYRSGEHPDEPGPKAFRQAHSHEPRIRFVGVWDTVGALGIPAGPLRSLTARRHAFHDVRLSRSVDVACHALAIDERRRSFRPTLWSTTPDPRQRVRQAWFAGAHSNVGGGYAQAGLSDVAFAWMRSEAEAAGLAFDAAAVAARVRPDPAGPLRDSRRGLWRVLPASRRPVGEATHQPQSVHPAAVARHQDPAQRYQPANLVAYIGSPGAVIEGEAEVRLSRRSRRAADSEAAPRPRPASAR